MKKEKENKQNDMESPAFISYGALHFRSIKTKMKQTKQIYLKQSS